MTGRVGFNTTSTSPFSLLPSKPISLIFQSGRIAKKPEPGPLLPTEVLFLIIEQVSYDDPSFLAVLCRISSEFCEFATPLLYRSIDLLSGLRSKGDQKPDSSYSSQRNVVKYTRHITIKKALDGELLINLLSRMEHLESIRWSYWPLPISVLHALSRRWPECKLYIKDLYIEGWNFMIDQSHFLNPQVFNTAIGSSNILSTDATFIRDIHSHARRFAKVLIICTKQETLRIKGSSQMRRGSQRDWPEVLKFNLPAKLPPVKKLVVDVFEVIQSPTIPWNLTRLRHLEVHGCGALSFFTSIQHHTNFVETLVVSHKPMQGFAPQGIEALDTFISNSKGLENLTTLNIFNHIPISTLCLHRDTLKSLATYRQRQDVLSYTQADSAYHPDDLNTLNRSCPHISSMILHFIFPGINLDSSQSLPNPEDFLAALAQFSRLDSLPLIGCFSEWTGSDIWRYHPHIRS